MNQRDLADYNQLSTKQLKKLMEINPQASVGLYVKVIGECGCISVYHPLFNRGAVVIDRNGNEVL